ncbi:MAG: hypothetical protein IPH68_12860 [Chitinophagaceae bacterium]|nr:hypothetical protein [Chitinophagaceae bacterium]
MKTLIKLMLIVFCTTRFVAASMRKVAGRNDILIGELMADLRRGEFTQ